MTIYYCPILGFRFYAITTIKVVERIFAQCEGARIHLNNGQSWKIKPLRYRIEYDEYKCRAERSPQ